MEQGIVVRALGGLFYVISGDTEYECVSRGRLKSAKNEVLVGDRVEISVMKENKGVIEKIHPRKSQLIRPTVANITKAVVVFAGANPDPITTLMDKFLVMLEKYGISTLLCINKMDLADRTACRALAASYEKVGYDVVLTSAKQAEGIDELKQAITGDVTVFTGPSGVGKSALMNRIVPGINLRTGEVSEKIGRGRHTTRAAELVPFDKESFLVDTPGFSSIDLSFIRKRELADFFPEFETDGQRCRFNGCLHKSEPDCAVKNAVENGVIPESRYQSYLLILEEVSRVDEWRKQ